jgi:hypothetical protein
VLDAAKGPISTSFVSCGSSLIAGTGKSHFEENEHNKMQKNSRIWQIPRESIDQKHKLFDVLGIIIDIYDAAC